MADRSAGLIDAIVWIQTSRATPSASRRLVIIDELVPLSFGGAVRAGVRTRPVARAIESPMPRSGQQQKQ
jgi:hypothetical protein